MKYKRRAFPPWGHIISSIPWSKRIFCWSVQRQLFQNSLTFNGTTRPLHGSAVWRLFLSSQGPAGIYVLWSHVRMSNTPREGYRISKGLQIWVPEYLQGCGKKTSEFLLKLHFSNKNKIKTKQNKKP